MLAPGDTVVVAVSGGPDSTCLLDVLARLATIWDLNIAVAHADHGLSEPSAEIAARVAREAAEQGHDVHVVRFKDLEGPNLQARARALRYGFLDTIAGRVDAAAIATGHTLDDRVETTLARLIHGAGTKGLAGLGPVESNRVRPLIGVRRSETRAYCEDRGLSFVDDPANEDERFERVAVRLQVVAAIEERWGAGAVRAVAASSERLREDATALDRLAERIYGGVAAVTEDEVTIERRALEPLPRALRRRVLERAIGRVRDRHAGIEEALDALEREHKPGARFAVAGGAVIALDSDQVTVTPPARDDGGGEGLPSQPASKMTP